MPQAEIEQALFLLLPFCALIYLSAPIIPTLALARKREVTIAVVVFAAGYVLPPVAAFELIDNPPWIDISDLYSLALIGPMSMAYLAICYAFLWHFRFLSRWKIT